MIKFNKSFFWFASLIIIALSILITMPSCSDHHAKWGYSGEIGPSHWEGVCQSGKSQSPINIIRKKTTRNKKLPKLRFHYKATKYSIVNNGHTIKVNYPGGSTLVIGKEKYQLLQFHFHSKSEHTINGRYYDLEMHLVHQSASGKLAVVGLLFKKGKKNAFLNKIWTNIPDQQNNTQEVNMKINAQEVLPKKLSYYNYNGSLTTPPCSEGVNWYVLSKIQQLSAKQLKKFQQFYNGNYRPIQKLNGRKIERK